MLQLPLTFDGKVPAYVVGWASGSTASTGSGKYGSIELLAPVDKNVWMLAVASDDGLDYYVTKRGGTGISGGTDVTGAERHSFGAPGAANYPSSILRYGETTNAPITATDAYLTVTSNNGGMQALPAPMFIAAGDVMAFTHDTANTAIFLSFIWAEVSV